MTTYEEVCLLAAMEEIWGFSPLLTEPSKDGIMEALEKARTNDTS